MTLEEIRMVRERWDRSYHSVYEARTMGAEVYRALVDAIDISTDLLEALKGLVNHQPTGPNDPHRVEVWERARAAIAKAEGEKG